MIRAVCRIELTEGGPASLGLVEAESVRVLPGLDLAGLVTDVADLNELRATLDNYASDGELIPLTILAQRGSKGYPRLIAPVDQQECWGAGCTYKVAEKDLEVMRAERPLYAATYEADRPMLFFKGNARSVVGPGGSIACRIRAERTIPEAELALLLAPSGSILAFTLANDVTALDLEQRNSLYQPQAKVFDGGVSLGPWWTLADTAGAAATATFTCVVNRSGRIVLEQSIDPGRLVRRLEDLAGWLFEAASFPQGAVLMTGSGAGVPPGFSLAGGDQVVIAHPVLGELRNPVLTGAKAR
jgi:2-dehydro-3-deoxy-D-arabinonate dehydratase